MTTSQNVTGTKGYECWFEYTPGYKATLKDGLRVIRDPDDPRWEGELQQPPFNGGAQGYVGVYEVLRFNDDVVQKKCIKGFSCTMNRAREFMRQVAALIEENSATPWDTEHHYRDLKEAEDKRRAREAETARDGFQSGLAALFAQMNKETSK